MLAQQNGTSNTNNTQLEGDSPESILPKDNEFAKPNDKPKLTINQSKTTVFKKSLNAAEVIIKPQSQRTRSQDNKKAGNRSSSLDTM